MKPKFFTLLFAIVANVGMILAASSGTCGESLTWTLSDDGILTISGTGDMDNFTLGKAPWNTEREVVMQVVIGNSVTSIGSSAFYNCTSLTSVAIPNSVTSIGSNAFYGCTGLTSVTIPNSVTSIGYFAFNGCSGLTKVNITDLAAWCNIAFSNNTANPLYYAKHLYLNGSEITNLIIPNSVTSIGSNAFSGCTGLTSVTIPNSVTSIGSSAFSGCTGLTSVTIPNSVTSIGSNAFYGCTGWTSVTIPNSVTSIGSSAFSGCTGLTSVTIPNSVTSIGNNAFRNVPNVVYSGTASGSPWGAKSVNGYVDGYFVYRDNTKTELLGCSLAVLGEITIPNSVTSIGSNAFYGCTGLTSVTIPNSVTSIGSSAFSGCTGLTQVNITDLAAWCNIAFSNNTANPLYYAKHLFVNGSEITDLTIPNSVTSIGEYAFSGCTGLTSVTIPNSVTSIGSNAFYGCTSLTSVTCEATTPPSLLSNSLNKSIPLYVPAESIETYQTTNYWKTFTNILPIASPTIYCHLTVTSADETMGIVNQVSGSYEYGTEINLIATPQSNYKFSHWSDGNTETPRTIILTKDTVLTAIFDINQDLTSIKIGDLYYNLDASNQTAEVTSGGNYSGSVVIPANVAYETTTTYSVTSIGDFAFEGCTGLTSVTIPNSVTSIGDNAFKNCSGLTSITIPNSVTSIRAATFYGCSSLTSVTIPNSVTDIGMSAFLHCTGLTSVTIPNSVTSIGRHAFMDCISLTSIAIPNSVTSIDNSVFTRCTSLTSIYVPCGELERFKQMMNNDSRVGYMPILKLYAITKRAENGNIDLTSETTICDESHPVCCLATPNYGYHFTQWSDGNTDNPQTIELTQDTTMEAIFAPNKYSISVACDSEQGQIKGESGKFDYLTKLTYTVIPNYGYHFTQWADGNTTNPRTIALTQDTILTALFAKNKYSINDGSNQNRGRINGIGSYDYLSERQIKAIPNRGYQFTQWSDGNTDNPRTIELTQDTIFAAIFDYILTGNCGLNNVLVWTLDTTSLTLNITGSGALSENYTYGTFIKSLAIGDEITQIGASAFFANFVHLKKVTLGTGVKVLEKQAFYNCSAIDTITCYSQRPPTVNTNALYGLQYSTVVYVPAAYLNNYMMHDVWGLYDVQPMGQALQLSVNIPESGVVSGAGTYAEETIATISATPNYGYHFVQWNDGNTDNPRTITITQDTAFVANFAPNQYSISVNYDKEQGIVEGETGKFDYKTQHTYTVIPNYGYHFTQWADGNTANPRTITLLQDITLTASFAKNSYTITLQSADPQQGSVIGTGTFEYLEQKQISATGNYGYHFNKWSDGNKDNPRTITLTQDTTLIAYYAVDKSGTCGADNRLQWSFTEDGTLTISGKGALTANYTFGVEAPTQMKTLIIGNEVTAIGERAFYGKSTINHLVLGAQLLTIGNYAFAECRNFDDITCYAQDVPTINSTTFENVGNKQYIYLYVPEDRERAYKRDVYWGEFDVQVKGASTTTTDDKVLTVEPSDNSASITWPTENNAASYTLQITKDGVVFCTLVFNSNGQLIGIAFAPSHDEAPHTPAATMSVAGMTFTVTGLNTASKYAYRLSVADENDNEIQAYSGEFATTGYQGEVNPGGQPENPISTALDQTVVEQTPIVTKFIRDGQLFILRDGKTYTVQGQEVK